MQDALGFIACASTFTPAELPRGRATFDVLELIRILIQEGVLDTAIPGGAT